MPASRNTRVYSRPRLDTRLPSPCSSETDPTQSSPGSVYTGLPLVDHASVANSHPQRKAISFRATATSPKRRKGLRTAAPKHSKLTQLHLLPDKPILRECKQCGLSYTRAAADDERVHRQHCARVRKGMEWSREDERALAPGELMEVAKGLKLKDGTLGRVISFRADISGKLGRKLVTLLDTVNLALSSPPLTPEALRASKTYLFLCPANNSSRESIVGAVIAQRISTAMAIASADSISSEANLIPVHIDSTNSLRLDPTPLPTSLGISRMFVSSSYRRKGIAFHMLDAAANTFIHACALDPSLGEVAFSQPTALGRNVMERWGSGACRIYEE